MRYTITPIFELKSNHVAPAVINQTSATLFCFIVILITNERLSLSCIVVQSIVLSPISTDRILHKKRKVER